MQLQITNVRRKTFFASLALLFLVPSKPLLGDIVSNALVNGASCEPTSTSFGSTAYGFDLAQCAMSGFVSADPNSPYYGGAASAQATSYGQIHLLAGFGDDAPSMTEDEIIGGSASATVTLSDSINIYNGTQSGFLQFTFDINGTQFGGPLLNETPTEPIVELNAFVLSYMSGSSGGVAYSNYNNSVSVDQGGLEVDLPYTLPGTTGTVPFSFKYLAYAFCPDAVLVNNNTQAACESSTNYLETISITGLTVLDSNGNPVPGATVTAASGYDYNSPTGVPEPSSLGCLAAGLLFLIVFASTITNDPKVAFPHEDVAPIPRTWPAKGTSPLSIPARSMRG